MSPTDFPREFVGVAAVVLLLGLKHGFDADHLAAIDAIACHNAPSRPRLARLSGALFSLGHGAVVVAVALSVSLLAQAWHTPEWLDALGAWLSIGVLILLAALNIAAVLRTPRHEATHLHGWRSGVFGRLLRAGHPTLVMGVGAVFAISFDTISQAALFAVTAAQFGGWRPALLLALLFTVGMLITDGVNGWWISRLVRAGGSAARVSSRVVALAVSGIGLLTAGLTLTTRFVPAAEAWAEGKELWFGTAIVVVLAASFVAGRRLGAGPVPARVEARR